MRMLARIVLVIAISATGLLSRPAAAAPVDHSDFSAFLEKYVLGGRVNYGAMLKDRLPLDRYRSQLRRVAQADYDKWSQDDKIAFWINLYNAETLSLMLDHPNTKSIRSVSWFLGAFRDRRILLTGFGDQRMSLNEVLETLRTKFREPRVHFALVGANAGCGRLRSEAYEGKRLNQQLEEQARDFIQDTTKARFDAPENTLYLSKTFDWYRTDFDIIGGAITTVARYADDGTRRRLTSGPVHVKYQSYDWSLNGKW